RALFPLAGDRLPAAAYLGVSAVVLALCHRVVQVREDRRAGLVLRRLDLAYSRVAGGREAALLRRRRLVLLPRGSGRPGGQQQEHGSSGHPTGQAAHRDLRQVLRNGSIRTRGDAQNSSRMRAKRGASTSSKTSSLPVNSSSTRVRVNATTASGSSARN